MEVLWLALRSLPEPEKLRRKHALNLQNLYGTPMEPQRALWNPYGTTFFDFTPRTREIVPPQTSGPKIKNSQ